MVEVKKRGAEPRCLYKLLCARTLKREKLYASSSKGPKKRLRSFGMSLKNRIFGKFFRSATRSVEEDLLAGTYCEKLDQPSVALFTLHKAGSTFLSERLALLLKQQKYDVADLGYHCRQDPGKLLALLEQESVCHALFSKKGIFHKAIRRPVNPDWVGETRIILVTRDPRDIMTSMYFSFKHSHVILKEADRSRKSKMETIAIDEFVLQSGQLEAMVDRLERYQEYLKNPQVCHITYEEMVTYPEAAENRMATFLGLPADREKIFAKEDFGVEREDALSHKRQVTPGDHARKLAPATIRHCNNKIRHLMPVYGWRE